LAEVAHRDGAPITQTRCLGFAVENPRAMAPGALRRRGGVFACHYPLQCSVDVLRAAHAASEPRGDREIPGGTGGIIVGETVAAVQAFSPSEQSDDLTLVVATVK